MEDQLAMGLTVYFLKIGLGKGGGLLFALEGRGLDLTELRILGE